MTEAEIKELQRKIGVDDDGFWGPISTRSCEQYLLQFFPKPSPWPKTDQASLTAFYGKPGDESQHVQLNVAGLGVKYEGRDVDNIRCHKKVAQSFRRVIEKLSINHRYILVGYKLHPLVSCHTR